MYCNSSSVCGMFGQLGMKVQLQSKYSQGIASEMSAAGQTTFVVDAEAFLNYLLKLNTGQLVGKCAIVFKLKYQQQQQQTT